MIRRELSKRTGGGVLAGIIANGTKLGVPVSGKSAAPPLRWTRFRGSSLFEQVQCEGRPLVPPGGFGLLDGRCRLLAGGEREAPVTLRGENTTARLMENYVSTWDYAVIPEFAISSAPCAESIRKFIPPEDLWPPGPSWGYHWADLDVLRALNYQVFGDERTGSLEEFVEATQIAQGTIFQWGIEHMRRRKPKSSAISICHFNTYAPDMKWGIVDYFQVPRLSHEYVKRAYQPLLVSLELARRRWLLGEKFQGGIWVVNDLHKEFRDCVLSIEVSDPRGRRLFERASQVNTIPADSSARYGAVEWKVQGNLGESFRVDAILRDAAGRTISANHYVLLLADQEQARRQCRERAKRLQAIKSQFHNADYYRFFFELSGQDGGR